jgi:hypothetical protein
MNQFAPSVLVPEYKPADELSRGAQLPGPFA